MKIKGLRWVVFSLIGLVSLINYLDRGTLNYMWVANTKMSFTPQQVTFDSLSNCYTATDNGEVLSVPAERMSVDENGNYQYLKIGGIASELGIVDKNIPEAEFKSETKRILGNITIFFMIAYGLSQLFSGKLYDKIGTRKGFAFSALLWGFADACTYFATGLRSIIAFRFGLGLGEAGPWPGTTKSNAEWFPSRERALAQGLFNASTSVGAILAPIVISFLYMAIGWRFTFAVVGCLAIVWVIPWLIINKKGPKEHPWITDKEKEYILSGQPEGKSTTPAKAKSWSELLRNRKNYSVILGRFLLDPVWWCFVTFIPIYLIEVYNLDIKEVAMSAWVPYVGAAIGAFAGGWLSGVFMKSGKSLNFSRKICMVIGVFIALPGVIGAAMATSSTMAVVMMALILGGYQFIQANLMTFPADLHNGATVGSLAGLAGASAVLGTIIAIFCVPYLTSVGWVPFFIFGGALFPLSVIVACLLAGKVEPIKD